MDFSTSSNGKKKLSALSYAPVPALFRDSLLKTGLLFHVYYENISTKNNFRGRKDFSGNVRSFPYFCLLHLLKGDAYFYNGSTCETSFFQEGSGLLVPPGMLQMYGGVTRPFVEDSICFTGPLPDLMLRSGLLRPGIFYLGGERRLLPVIRAIHEACPDAAVVAPGGAGKMEHFRDALTVGHADSALAATLFHFGILKISDLKEYLAREGVPVRRT